MTTDQEYVLGTHDEDIARLALQHQVWRPQVLDVWRRAGFSAGQTLIDGGSGPGNASLDLAELVGPTGRVIPLDKSRRFLDVADARAHERGRTHISTCELDPDRDPLPDIADDGAWSRWVLSFVTHPRDLIARVAERLKPGAPFVVHDYFDYATWRTAPPSPEIEEFVQAVMRTWRESGGEPDIGLQLPAWLDELGFDLREVRPIVETTSPGEPKWAWLAAFIESGRRRLEGLGALTPDRSAAIAAALAALGLFEIIAVRR